MAENIDPEKILKKVERPGLTVDLILSVVLHAVLIALTSFGLFRAWTVWGVHSPSEIKLLEKAEAKAKAEEARKAAQAEKAQTDAAKAEPEAAPAAKTETPSAAAKPAAAPAAKPAQPAKEALPLEKEVSKPTKVSDLSGLGLDL